MDIKEESRSGRKWEIWIDIYTTDTMYKIDGLPRWFSGKESAGQCRCQFDLWVRKISWRRKWQPTPVFLPGKSHGQSSLATVHEITKESDTTERLNNNKFTITPHKMQENDAFPSRALLIPSMK